MAQHTKLIGPLECDLNGDLNYSQSLLAVIKATAVSCTKKNTKEVQIVEEEEEKAATSCP